MSQVCRMALTNSRLLHRVGQRNRLGTNRVDTIFGVTQENGTLKSVRQIGTVPLGLVSFGTDETGNIYVVGYEGMIYRLDFSESRFDEVKLD